MMMLSDALFVTAIFAFLILFLMVTPWAVWQEQQRRKGEWLRQQKLPRWWDFGDGKSMPEPPDKAEEQPWRVSFLACLPASPLVRWQLFFFGSVA